MRLNPILVALTVGIIALWVLIFASYAHAENAIFMNLKTATFAITKQVKPMDATLAPCAADPTKGICIDSIDTRLYTVQP